jgi:hypothetical protein
MRGEIDGGGAEQIDKCCAVPRFIAGWVAEIDRMAATVMHYLDRSIGRT